PLMYHDIRYVLVFLVSAFSFAREEHTYSVDLYSVVDFYLLVYVSFILSYLGDFAAFSPVRYFENCDVATSFSVVYLLIAVLFIFICLFMFLFSFLTWVILLLFPLSSIFSIVLLRILFLLFIF